MLLSVHDLILNHVSAFMCFLIIFELYGSRDCCRTVIRYCRPVSSVVQTENACKVQVWNTGICLAVDLFVHTGSCFFDESEI